MKLIIFEELSNLKPSDSTFVVLLIKFVLLLLSAFPVLKLIKMSKGNVSAFIFVINLFDLGGCDNLVEEGYKIENLIEFPGH